MSGLLGSGSVFSFVIGGGCWRWQEVCHRITYLTSTHCPGKPCFHTVGCSKKPLTHWHPVGTAWRAALCSPGLPQHSAQAVATDLTSEAKPDSGPLLVWHRTQHTAAPYDTTGNCHHVRPWERTVQAWKEGVTPPIPAPLPGHPVLQWVAGPQPEQAGAWGGLQRAGSPPGRWAGILAKVPLWSCNY